MGHVLSKTNRLYWLGRYNERVYTSLSYMMDFYDALLDGAPDHAAVCDALDIPNIYEDAGAFFTGFVFDAENPDSIASAAEHMLGNGMVLRETISTATLSYLQMAVNAIGLAAKSDAPAVAMQWALDDIMAFRGSCDDHIADEQIRNILKAAVSVERISMYGRLRIRQSEVQREMRMLIYRMNRTRLPIEPQSQSFLTESLMDGGLPERRRLIEAVESLFVI
ncbi:MAG: alpha-E domain-containing protein [Clostridiales Family XIII bacterium]|jgi:uncharacterized alpha-E superfamily protein|nr:alpha-E domain-containing protein [Clostridiales Family XIII bacterium]